MPEFDLLHPALQYHIVNSLGWSTLRPTQLQAIAPILAARHCLLLAPTAGGKTEAAFMPVLSRMLSENWDGVSVLYVCPIKALLNNLEQRLSYYCGLVGRRVALWHGDVSASAKQKALRHQPDILLTTPESLEGMLVSSRIAGQLRQNWLGNLRVVVADELHAFASDDRGWHLRALLARLDAYASAGAAGCPLQRIGLSATVSNPQQLLEWFAPQGERQVVGSASVSLEALVTLDYVGSLNNAATLIARLHRGCKRLVFCDSRASSEQLTNMLRGLEVRTFVSHASLSRDERKQAETAFAEEKDCVIVATSTLELGIDVGDLDYVIQIDAPGSVSSFLQRMGRTGRRSGSSRNCLFLCTSDEAMLQALGICHLWGQAWVEAAEPPPAPWGLVAQQALAICLERAPLPRQDLQSRLMQAFPELPASTIAALLEHMLALGYVYDSGGVWQIGPQAEKDFGRAHFRDLLASFSGTELFSGRYGSSEIGFIDPLMLCGESAQRLLLLGGKSWRVHEIEWQRRIAWLEPVAEGGKANWSGAPRVLSRSLAQAIKLALRLEPENGQSGAARLSQRAQAKLALLRDAIPAGSDAPFVLSKNTDGSARLWTFAGDKANRCIARNIPAWIAVKRIQGLALDLEQMPDLQNLTGPMQAGKLGELELAELAQGIKFAACLPADLVAETIHLRQFEDFP